MILWVALFLLVVVISLILAYQSMKDYQEVPQNSKVEYGLFLIRQLDNFDAKFLDTLLKLTIRQDLIISLERLFKGGQAALVIFGPKIILDQFSQKLNLLELQDYAQDLDPGQVSVWEVGVKTPHKFNPQRSHIFANFPPLEPNEQFFWQVVMGGSQAQIRAAFISPHLQRKKSLTQTLQSLGGLIKVPKPFSAAQMIDFYKSRSLSQDSKVGAVDSAVVMQLVKI